MNNNQSASRFGTWLLHSVFNAAIKAARNQKKQVSLSAETGNEAKSFEDLLFDKQPSPEIHVEMDELSQQFGRSMLLTGVILALK